MDATSPLEAKVELDIVAYYTDTDSNAFLNVSVVQHLEAQRSSPKEIWALCFLLSGFATSLLRQTIFYLLHFNIYSTACSA